MAKLDLNEVRKFAGLPPKKLLTEQDASEQHIDSEERLFVDCCSCLKDVMKMCDGRLKEKVTPEHKAQYTKLREEAKRVCDIMQQHLKSYK